MRSRSLPAGPPFGICVDGIDQLTPNGTKGALNGAYWVRRWTQAVKTVLSLSIRLKDPPQVVLLLLRILLLVETYNQSQ